MKQLTAGVCAESAIVALWQGLSWEELGVKGDELKELLSSEVYNNMMHNCQSGRPLLQPVIVVAKQVFKLVFPVQQLEFLLGKEVTRGQVALLEKLISRFKASDITNDDIILWIEVSHVIRHVIRHVTSRIESLGVRVQFYGLH